jgi:hypothetical protein
MSGDELSQATTLLPGDFFARPEIDPSIPGNSLVGAIFHAVGQALTQWESAECALALLFQVMSEAKEPGASHAVRRAFGSIEHSAGRRKALIAIAEVYFGPYWSNSVVKTPFNRLMKAFEQGSSRRDEIAHGMAYSVTVNNEPKGAFLFPSEYNTQRTFPFAGPLENDPLAFTRAKYRYTTAVIHEFTRKFGQLRDMTYDYARQIRKVGGRPAVVLDSEIGPGTAEKVEAMIAEQEAKKSK